MITRPIIDAGPGLNFLSANKERLLIAVLGPLSAPETVQDEVLRKSAQDVRFRAAATTWRRLTTASRPLIRLGCCRPDSGPSRELAAAYGRASRSARAAPRSRSSS